MSIRSILVCLLLLATVARDAQSQRVTQAAVSTDALTAVGTIAATVAQPSSSGSSGSFALEALGGSVGSLVGIGIVALSSRCGVDDLGCVITSIGAGGALGVVGATVGTVVTARLTDAPQSGLGAALGAIVGTGVGLGVHYLLNRNSDRNLGDKVVVPIFVISQGVFAAAGSRLMARER
jgi:hypothetical protein